MPFVTEWMTLCTKDRFCRSVMIKFDSNTDMSHFRNPWCARLLTRASRTLAPVPPDDVPQPKPLGVATRWPTSCTKRPVPAIPPLPDTDQRPGDVLTSPLSSSPSRPAPARPLPSRLLTMVPHLACLNTSFMRIVWSATGQTPAVHVDRLVRKRIAHRRNPASESSGFALPSHWTSGVARRNRRDLAGQPPTSC